MTDLAYQFENDTAKDTCPPYTPKRTHTSARSKSTVTKDAREAMAAYDCSGREVLMFCVILLLGGISLGLTIGLIQSSSKLESGHYLLHACKDLKAEYRRLLDGYDKNVSTVKTRRLEEQLATDKDYVLLKLDEGVAGRLAPALAADIGTAARHLLEERGDGGGPCVDLHGHACAAWFGASPAPDFRAEWSVYDAAEYRAKLTARGHLLDGRRGRLRELYRKCLRWRAGDPAVAEGRPWQLLRTLTDSAASLESLFALVHMRLRFDSFLTVYQAPSLRDSKARGFYLDIRVRQPLLPRRTVLSICRAFRLCELPHCANALEATDKVERAYAVIMSNESVQFADPLDSRAEPITVEQLGRYLPQHRHPSQLLLAVEVSLALRSCLRPISRRSYLRHAEPAFRTRQGGNNSDSSRQSSDCGLIDAAHWQTRVERPVWRKLDAAGQRSAGMSEAARAHFARVPLIHDGPPVKSGEFSPLIGDAAASRFSQLSGIEPRIAEALQRMGVDEMTPVQRGSVPVGLAGLDATVQAETGSGKTLAFLVPMVTQLAARYPDEAMGLVRASGRQTQYPSGLVICPTRELAQQTLEQLMQLVCLTQIRCGLLVGGLNPRPMKDQLLSRGVHVAVATPGRLLDFLEQRILSLAACRYLVLDEADRCLDMGFERDIRRILRSPQFGAPPPDRRQTSLFSATFPPDVNKVAEDFLRADRCVRVRAGRSDTGPVPASIRQEVLLVGSVQSERLEALDRVIKAEIKAQGEGGDGKSVSRCLVFVQTKLAADRLHRRLQRMGYPASAIHGDMSQMTRQYSLNSFKSGRSTILVATDVAARGLDLPGVSLVVNFDSPKEADQYVHRVGRTGRLGRPGHAVTFVDNRDLGIKGFRRGLVSVLRACGQAVPDFLLGQQSDAEEGVDTDSGDWGSQSRRNVPNFKKAVWRSSGDAPRFDQQQYQQRQSYGYSRESREAGGGQFSQRFNRSRSKF